MKQKWEDCPDYKKRGHNYCRMCGFHLTKGYVQHVRIALIYNTNEKYCGYCGGLRHKSVQAKEKICKC